ncbi:glutathione S-transferase family protein [Sandarakinorhabdus sp.]|uniref:glutathione S-transferase family protein n=1 Tax=Sandarakinorhabdus sp. TaxID=1916663 RepID=UPI00286EA2A6|nr:glutathione S-transferase family protein [Sandarakinorhabdus sp.]
MTPILFHYEASPFAELVRIALGIKGLEWGSVIVPRVLPKPDQTALTGAYARTPMVQLGADIYCDTGAILPALEALPGPSLYPLPLGSLHRLVANWAGGPQFMAHVGAALGPMPPGAMGEDFIRDRQARFGLDMAALGRAAPHLAGQAEVAASWLSDTLADGRAFIGGDAPGAGDCALYANLWFVKGVPFAARSADAMLAFAGVGDWFGRMAAFGAASGRGTRREMSGPDALAAALAQPPRAISGTVAGPFVAGMTAAVRQEGTHDEATTGALLRCDAGGIILAREIPGGTVHVHFPRLGQVVTPA